MKKLLHLSILCLCLLPCSILADINDISKSDGAYAAIKTSIDNGHLSLFKGNIFNPSHAITRKEFAIVIDDIIKESKKNDMSLSAQELQELKHLSNSFKTNFTDMEAQIRELLDTRLVHSDEITTLHHDLSKLNASLHSDILELKKQQLYTWIGIGGATLLGLLAN
jgi:hypothetical protein